MKKLAKRIFRGKYDPAKYWNTRENPNSDSGLADDRVEFDAGYIRAMVGDAKDILELGPGVGRTLRAYSAAHNLTSLDLSTSYSDKLARAASSRGLSLRQLHLDGPDDRFPFDNRRFAVGVCSQVLLHVPPEHVVHSVSELVRVCERVVVITKYRHGAPTVDPHVQHVFNHDYFGLCTSLGCSMNELVFNEGRICFVIERSGFLADSRSSAAAATGR